MSSLLPLYKDHAIDPGSDTLKRTANTGLRFERFCDGFAQDWLLPGDAGKKLWLDKFSGDCGDRALLENAARRNIRLATNIGGVCITFATNWRFVSGLGQEHAVENGFAWHYTLGVPYLPGSSVKGVVRAWMQWRMEEGETDQAKFYRWFGKADEEDDTDTPGDAAPGDYIFFDALPVRRPGLIVDVMTPHYGPWYACVGERDDTKRKAPGDWYDPTPVPFLAVRNAVFLFAIAPRNARAKQELTEVVEALAAALDWLGAGAKTAAGYGRMVPEPDALNTLQEMIAVDEMSDFELEIEALRKMLDVDRSNNRREPGGRTTGKFTELIEAIDNALPSERAALGRLAKEIYDHHGWGKKDKKKDRKDLVRRLLGGVDEAG